MTMPAQYRVARRSMKDAELSSFLLQQDSITFSIDVTLLADRAMRSHFERRRRFLIIRKPRSGAARLSSLVNSAARARARARANRVARRRE